MLEEDVIFLRTILRDYQEKHFSLYFKSEKEEQTIEYKNGKLFYVHISQNIGKNTLNAKYKKGGSFSFSCTDLEKAKLLSEKSNIDIVEEIRNMKDCIVSLNAISKVELSEHAKIIIQLYQLFYNRNLACSNYFTDKEVQYMLVILSSFGITIPEVCNFSISYGEPVSYSIKCLLDKLEPYFEIEKVDNPVPLQDDVIERTKIIGQRVKQFIYKHENPMECLKNIALIVYYNRYNLIENTNMDYITNRTELTEKEINEVFSLGRRITKKIEEK